MTPKQFVIAVESALMPLSHPALARTMAAYMKEQFEFLGIKTPMRRAATKSLIRQQSEDAIVCAEALWAMPYAILHQLGYGSATDTDRLFRLCLANASDPEFFIRKAIGWALRQTAHHDPAAIRKFLKQHGEKISSLAIREADKHL